MKFAHMFFPPHARPAHPPVPPHIPPAPPHHGPRLMIELDDKELTALCQMLGEETAETALEVMQRAPGEVQLQIVLQLRLFMSLNKTENPNDNNGNNDDKEAV